MTRLRSAAITTTPATSLRATASRIASSIADGWNCCAPAANGKAATLPQRVMNSRRFIGSSSLWHREGSLAEAERRYHAEVRRSTTRTHRATKKAGRIACPHAARQFNGMMPTSDLCGYPQAAGVKALQIAIALPASRAVYAEDCVWSNFRHNGAAQRAGIACTLPFANHRVSTGRQGAAAHDCVTRPKYGREKSADGVNERVRCIAFYCHLGGPRDLWHRRHILVGHRNSRGSEG